MLTFTASGSLQTQENDPPPFPHFKMEKKLWPHVKFSHLIDHEDYLNVRYTKYIIKNTHTHTKLLHAFMHGLLLRTINRYYRLT